jgi:hypothetical protein
MLSIKAAEKAADTEIWKWLKELMNRLGEDGMSSEESDVEDGPNGPHSVYRVKKLKWRRDIEQELAIIDALRFKSGIFTERGAQPVARTRTRNNPTSDREAPKGWPRSLYDRDWFNEKDEEYRQLTLHIPEEDFKWMKVIAMDKSQTR